MEMSDLVIKPGDRWRMRNGEIARILSLMDSGNVSAYWGDQISVFAPDGRYWFHDEESEFDLIALVEEVSA
jgi:hypothetical protein